MQSFKNSETLGWRINCYIFCMVLFGLFYYYFIFY